MVVAIVSEARSHAADRIVSGYQKAQLYIEIRRLDTFEWMGLRAGLSGERRGSLCT